MKVVGLTGGIGSGKTTVANFFRELNVPVFIADEEAKKIMNRDAAVKKKIKELFGEDSYTGGDLDRKKLASKVFHDKSRLESLNAIVHPAVGRHFEEWKKAQTGSYVIYEAAILFEKGSDKKCDFVILVTAPYDLRIQRLQKRDRSSIEEIEARMAHQWPDDKKAALADFIIENTDIQGTWEKVRSIHDRVGESA